VHAYPILYEPGAMFPGENTAKLTVDVPTI
jgi:hypothetical protein